MSHDLYFSHDAFFAEMPERVFLDIQNINWFAECALMDKLCNMNWEISNIIYQSDSNTVHGGLIFHIWNTVQTQSLRKQYYCSVVIKLIKIIQSTFKKKTKNTKTTTKPLMQIFKCLSMKENTRIWGVGGNFAVSKVSIF